MDGLCNTSQTLCTRCQVNPRLPKQRWCRECLTATQRARRAVQHVTQAEDTSTPVTHAETQAMPCVTPGAIGTAVGMTHAQRQALAAYWHAVNEYEARRMIKPGAPLMDRTGILVPLALRVEHARQWLAILGINPEALEGWEPYGDDP
jgi:hypothetical protein